MKLIAWLIVASGAVQTSPGQFFGHDYQTAYARMQYDRPIIAATAKTYGISERVLCAMVFPEYIRYSYLSGLLETASLELVYVQLGSRAIDFSIGHFQMKPSFAEEMENKIRHNEALRKKYGALLSHSKPGRTQRQLRLNRLNDPKIQAVYACAFIEVCIKQYGLQALNEDEQLQYLATAYNRGLHNDKTQLETGMRTRTFPYGTAYRQQQFAYWEVALDYYMRYRENAEV